MITFFDFETTSLIDPKMRSNDPKQPHIVSMALVHTDDDGKELAHRHIYVRPDGWDSEPDALKVHGLTKEFLLANGMPEAHAIALWVDAMQRCRLRVAHNQFFDLRVARVAQVRYGYERPLIEEIEARPNFCTMNAAKPLANLPPTEKMLARGMTGPKTPSLAECHQVFFAEEAQGLHGALNDARGCARVYWHIKKLAAGEPKA